MALTRWTFAGKVMSLLFNMLSRLICFPSKGQVDFNFMAPVTICSDFGVQKIKSIIVSIVSPSICHEVMGVESFYEDLQDLLELTPQKVSFSL